MATKSFFSRVRKFFTDEEARFYFLSGLGLYNRMPDDAYLQRMFRYKMGYELDLENPVTFNEKLQWLKLHDRKPEYVQMVDKVAAKDFVAGVIGREHVIPTLRVWDRAKDVDFGALPEQFVIKCNHNSGGGTCICKDRGELDPEEVRAGLERALGENYYYCWREWPYKDVRPMILAEPYMTDGINDDLMDYKVFVFGGRAEYVQVDYDRFTEHRRNIYSREWERMPFTLGYPTDPSRQVGRPECLGELLAYAEELARAAGAPPFLRADFYIIGGEIYFGELTFYPGAGLECFNPYEYDEVFGNLIALGAR